MSAASSTPAASSSTPESKFDFNLCKIGERFFVEDRGRLYEAKILQIGLDEEDSQKLSFFVHFIGWNKSWDCWKSESLCRPMNGETKKEAKRLKQEAKKGDRVVAAKRAKTAAVGKRKKAKKNHQAPDHQITYRIPIQLKFVLQEDNEQVNKRCINYKLPMTHTVQQILEDFKASDHTEKFKKQIPEMISGMADYFDLALERNLLYRCEKRPIREALRKEGKSPKEICGLIYLLRLLVKLPVLMSYNHLKEEQVVMVKATCQQLINFLGDNLHKYTEPEEGAAQGVSA